MKRLLALFALLAAFAAEARTLPQAEPVPGGVAVIPIETDGTSMPHAYLGNSRVMVVHDAAKWFAVVGLPLSFHAGKHELRVIDDDGHKQQLSFLVHPKKYGEQHITIKNKRLVNPTREDMKRINRDSSEIHAAFTTWRELTTPPLTFDLPVEGPISGVFGTRRFFNNQERHPHTGLDLAAPRGTPIRAPADGVIVGIGNYFFNGRTVFIDHGQGLISMYNHMDRIAVQLGEAVKRGQRIAELGESGTDRPKLHFEIRKSGKPVDPMRYLPGNPPS